MKASKWMRCLTFALAAMLLCPVGLMANNIRIIGTPEVKKKADGKTAAINFTLAWDNSWKSSKPANWDAAWIYVKCWDGDQWNHVYLEDDGHTAGNKDLPGYFVENRDKSGRKMLMTYECGKSVVWKKWHVNPEEDSCIATVGIFLYRKDSLGSGDVVVPGISLLWDYSEQGFVEDDDLVVKVFAVEMVYVPEGAYYLGGKGTAGSQVASFTCNANTFGFPMYVKSEDSIVLANNADPTTLWSIAGMAAGTLPTAFPKGYQAFYIMKYELTQEAYADFLNTLNQGQQDGRIQGVLANLAVGTCIWGGSLASYRNNIEVMQRAPTVLFGVDANNSAPATPNSWNQTVMVEKTYGTETDSCAMGIDGQDLAVNFVSMYDLLAYADFAGLRPMTELEYEKACRGNKPVVNDEYAWGSVTMTYANKAFHTAQRSWYAYNTTTILNINTGNEQMPEQYNCGASHGGAQDSRENSWWTGWCPWHVWHYAAPIRVGCFADSTSTRAAAGATYWGVMNMSDNCSELCISVGNTSAVGPGRAFEGVHGDGQLQPNGNADVTGWAMVTTAAYYIPRGMIFPTTWSGWQGSYTFGSHQNGDWTIGQNLVAGMVSSRTLVNHGVVGTTREYSSFMSGIRCVRTANAAK